MFPMNQQTVWAIFQARGRGLVQSAAAIFDVRLQAGRSGP